MTHDILHICFLSNLVSTSSSSNGTKANVKLSSYPNVLNAMIFFFFQILDFRNTGSLEIH